MNTRYEFDESLSQLVLLVAMPRVSIDLLIRHIISEIERTPLPPSETGEEEAFKVWNN